MTAVQSATDRTEAGREPERFDRMAPVYDAWYATPTGRLVDRLEKDVIFGLVGDRTCGLALDLSCGTGNYALALAERGLRVVGLDISEAMLRVARSKGALAGHGVSLVRADASALPFRAGTFDLVTMILGLEFTADRRRPLAEARRALKEGGCIVVAILNRAGLWTLWRRLKRLVLPSVWRGATFLGVGDLRGLLREQGFVDLRCRRAVHFLPLFAGGAIGWLERWEAVGSRWVPAGATFVAAAARRP